MDESNLARGKPGLRWVRPLLAAIAVEFALAVVAIILFSLQSDPTRTLDIVVPPACLVLFIPAGYWAAKGSSAPLLNAGVAGLWGIGLYIITTLIAAGSVADFSLESSLRPAYLLANGLKFVGSMIGGWLVVKKAMG